MNTITVYYSDGTYVDFMVENEDLIDFVNDNLNDSKVESIVIVKSNFYKKYHTSRRSIKK